MALQVGSSQPASTSVTSPPPVRRNPNEPVSAGYNDTQNARPVVHPDQVDFARKGSIANSPNYHGKHATDVSTPAAVNTP